MYFIIRGRLRQITARFFRLENCFGLSINHLVDTRYTKSFYNILLRKTNKWTVSVIIATFLNHVYILRTRIIKIGFQEEDQYNCVHIHII